MGEVGLGGGPLLLEGCERVVDLFGLVGRLEGAEVSDRGVLVACGAQPPIGRVGCLDQVLVESLWVEGGRQLNAGAVGGSLEREAQLWVPRRRLPSAERGAVGAVHRP